MTSIDMDKQHSLAEQLAAATPARVGIYRAGTRPKTSDWLKFRYDHALAKDAVHSELSEQFLKRYGGLDRSRLVQSTAEDRADYILFPPKGKRAPENRIEALQAICPKHMNVQIVICDGLSPRAVEENAPDLLAILQDGFEMEKITTGLPIVITLARVAIGDQIAHALSADLVINLIGERPGLSTATSMSAYITYNPGPHTISSDRTVVSNIHKGGTPPVEAGAFIIKLVKTILETKVSGVRLQQLT